MTVATLCSRSSRPLSQKIKSGNGEHLIAIDESRRSHRKEERDGISIIAHANIGPANLHHTLDLIPDACCRNRR